MEKAIAGGWQNKKKKNDKKETKKEDVENAIKPMRITSFNE